MTPAEQVKAAFTKFRSIENWDFETLWPIAGPLLILGAALLARKWMTKEYKKMKIEAGVENDKQD